MVDKILKASLKSPQILSSLTIQQFSQSDIVLALSILNQTRPPPPLFYTQLVSNLLSSHFKYNPSILALQEFDQASLLNSLKNISLQYFRIKKIRLKPFSVRDSIEAIKSLSELAEDEKYEKTAFDLLDYFCDFVVRSEWELNCNESADLLSKTHKFKHPVSLFTLSLMCKAVIINDLDHLSTSLEFYSTDDEFMKAIKQAQTPK